MDFPRNAQVRSSNLLSGSKLAGQIAISSPQILKSAICPNNSAEWRCGVSAFDGISVFPAR